MSQRGTSVNGQDGQGRRARKAAATRRAIRQAATQAFLHHGYGATSMREIAAAAGIGERTLYDAFGTKEALFQHVADIAVGGDELPITVADRAETLDALGEDRPHRAVALFARQSAAILERAAPIIMVAVESSGAEPAMRRFADRGADATHEIAATFIDHLADIHPIDDPATATATLVAIASPHVHHILRTLAGMGADDYLHWLTDTLTATLLDRRPTDPATSPAG